MPNQVQYSQPIEIVTNSSTFGTGLVGIDSGDTVTAISSDGLTFQAVDATTDANGGTTISGTYVTFNVLSNGNVTLTPTPNNQTVIDDIYANEQSGHADTPLQDTFYYKVTDAQGITVTDTVSYQYDDIAIGINTDPNNGGTADYFSPETVQPNTPTPIPGLSVHKSLATGQTSDADYALTVKVSADASTLQIAPSSGGAASDGTITQGSDGSVTIQGTVTQINSDLERLVYSSSTPGTHRVILTPTDDTLSQGTIVGLLSVACFCAGTMILTPAGEVPVETLAIGDRVTILGGEARPVRWIGTSSVSTRFGDPLRVLPIRIAAGALAANVPCRDLRLSPDHAVLLDHALVQAGALVNGSTITRMTDAPERFAYYHVELSEHAILLADGAPAESFVDNTDRLGFDNWEEHQALYGEQGSIAELPYPRAKSQRQVPQAIRDRLAARAADLSGIVTAA